MRMRKLQLYRDSLKGDMEIMGMLREIKNISLSS